MTSESIIFSLFLPFCGVYSGPRTVPPRAEVGHHRESPGGAASAGGDARGGAARVPVMARGGADVSVTSYN